MTSTKNACSNAATLEQDGSIPGIDKAGTAQVQHTTEPQGFQGKLALKPVEVAQLLGIGRNAAYDLCHRADFPAIQVGANSIIVPVDALRRWLDNQAEQGRGSL